MIPRRIDIGALRISFPASGVSPDRAETVARLVYDETVRLLERADPSQAAARQIELLDVGIVRASLAGIDDHELARQTAGQIVLALRNRERVEP